MKDLNDIRWIQSLNNYEKALHQLDLAVALAEERELTSLEEQGMIKAFEYTQELACNVMKNYLVYQGITNIIGSRDAIREAFSEGLISDGEGWMSTISSRNQTKHTYNEETADEIANDVISKYHLLFNEFLSVMNNKKKELLLK